MSSVQTTQIKVTLSNELYLHLKSKAEKLGLNLASYIRHLVINDVKDIEIPVFKMSEKREKIAELYNEKLKDFPEIFSVTANVREVLVSGVTNIAEDDVTAVVLMVTDVAPAGMTPEPKEVELASVVPTLYFLAVTVPAILTLPY